MIKLFELVKCYKSDRDGQRAREGLRPQSSYRDIEKRLDFYDEDVVTWYKKLVSENYDVMPGGVYPDVVKNPGIPIVPNMKVPVLILNGSNEYVVDMEDQLQKFKELGTPDKSIIIQPGGFHLMFLEKRGHVGQQESIFFWMTKK